MDREERFLMRQRGAGARKLRNSGFELELPGLSNVPLKPFGSGKSRRTPLSSRSNPQATLIIQTSSRRTPASKQIRVVDKQNTSRISASSNGQNSISRKRKLGSISQGGELIAGGAGTIGIVDGESHVNSVEKTIKKRKKRKSIGQNSKKRIRTSLPSPNIQEPPFLLPTAIAGSDLQDKDTDSVEHLPATPAEGSGKVKKRKKRKSIGQNSKKRVKSISPISSASKVRSSLPPIVEGPLIEGDLPAKPKKPMKRRSMVILPDGERKILSTATSPARNPQKLPEDVFTGPVSSTRRTLESLEEELEGESEQDVEEGSSLAPGNPHSSPITQKPPRKPPIQGKKAKKAAVLPAKALIPRARRRSSTVTSNSAENITRRRRSNTIPITVHRFSRQQALETITEDDETAIPSRPFPQKSGVNAIDVLSQICREVIAKAVNSMRQAEANAYSSEKKAQMLKRKAVEMFGEELDTRLFQMTEALDTNHSLTTRLRHATREKSTLRSELQDLKIQGYETIREIEEVRTEHERKTKLSQEKTELITMIEDIELAVQRGRALQRALIEKGEEDGVDPRGLEMRMKVVAGKVSKVGGEGGGLLERVRGFNDMVERALQVL